ncbi:hypothetical protein [Micromonospora fluostatini]|uniref:hypothetical protein n=1 Tax=Micromonospora sp. JCM 30529 TaxID=3421643 RepID=UPI003D162542
MLPLGVGIVAPPGTPATASSTAYGYVTNYRAGTVSVRDTSTNTVAAMVGVGTSSYAVAIAPDG